MDTVIISHGHYDHGGGLGTFLKLNDKAKIYIKKSAHRLEVDTFEHEQYLILSDYDSRALVTGCSHKGIINILDFYSQKFGYSDRVLTNVIGGFHLFNPAGNKTEDKAFVKKLAEMPNEYDVTFHTCHCTSEKLFFDMVETMGEKLHYLSTGNNLLIQ